MNLATEIDGGGIVGGMNGSGSAATNDDDTIEGTGGPDTINGLGGDDVIEGRGGDDAIKGGVGDDTLNGRGGDDVIAGGSGDDRINGGNGDDSLRGGEGDDFLKGGMGDDVMSGGEGNDRLVGGKGDDRLVGNEGDDVMFGGEGADVFVFSANEDTGSDRIMDFEAGIDRIALTNGAEITDIADGPRGAVLTLSNGGTIELRGVSAEEFQNANGAGDDGLPSFYDGSVELGGTFEGSVSSDGFEDDPDPDDASYVAFEGGAGDEVTITGTRGENDYDMSFYLVEGLVEDPETQFGEEIDEDDPGVIGFYDDEISNPGPFGDPQANVTLPSDGEYTIIVTNFASDNDDGGDGRFDYTLGYETNEGGSDVPPEPGIPIDPEIEGPFIEGPFPDFELLL